MSRFGHPQEPCLCLVHDDGMVRSIVASVARELNLPPVRVFSSPDAAYKQIPGQSLDALMILAEGQEAVAFLKKLRTGELNWSVNTPLAILAPPSSSGQIAQLIGFKPARLLLTPFRIKDLITTLEYMTQREAATS